MSSHVLITEAIVARLVDYGEADRICTLLTHGLGKISVLAKGARRSRRRFGAALSLFVRGEAVLHKPLRGELFRLERFDAAEDLGLLLTSDLTQMAHGSYLIELARELWPPEQRDVALFDLLWTALSALAHHGASATLLRVYELKLLAVIGFAPSLTACVRCGCDLSEGGGDLRVGFSPTQGGVICSACGHDTELSLSRPVLAQLQRLNCLPFEACTSSPMADGVGARIKDLTSAILNHYLSKRPQSVSFIGQVNAAAKGGAMVLAPSE